MQFKRKVSSTHPLPKTSVPFMPKFCESAEEYTLRIISKDLFTLDTMVQNRGAPYTDSFRVHTRTKYENTPTGSNWFAYSRLIDNLVPGNRVLEVRHGEVHD